MPSKGRMRKKAQSAFFLGFRGYALTASRAGVDTPAIFAPKKGVQKCLLGSLPKPGDFGTFCPKVYCLRHRRYRSCSLFLRSSVAPSR